MKPLACVLAAVSLAACLAARAEPVTVSAGGTATLAAFGTGPVATSIQFSMDSVVANPILQPNAFGVSNLSVAFTHGASSQTITSNDLFWFDYADSFYSGFDFRLYDVLAPGDLVQFIFSPGLVFSGPATAPTLDLVSLGPIGGMVCYAPNRFGVCTASYFSDGSYSVTAATGSVPEPPTLALIPLAVLMAVGASRARRV